MPYAVAQGTVELPYVLVQCILYSVITYFLIHLQLSVGVQPMPSLATTFINLMVALQEPYHPLHAANVWYAETCLIVFLLDTSRCTRGLCCNELLNAAPYMHVAAKFFWYFLFLFLTLLYYTYYGLCAIVISPSLQVQSLDKAWVKHLARSPVRLPTCSATASADGVGCSKLPHCLCSGRNRLNCLCR